MRGSRFRKWAVVGAGVILFILSVYLLGTNSSFYGTTSTSTGNTETINPLTTNSSVYMPLPPISSSQPPEPSQTFLLIGPLVLVVTAAVVGALIWKRKKR